MSGVGYTVATGQCRLWTFVHFMAVTVQQSIVSSKLVAFLISHRVWFQRRSEIPHVRRGTLIDVRVDTPCVDNPA